MGIDPFAMTNDDDEQRGVLRHSIVSNKVSFLFPHHVTWIVMFMSMIFSCCLPDQNAPLNLLKC